MDRLLQQLQRVGVHYIESDSVIILIPFLLIIYVIITEDNKFLPLILLFLSLFWLVLAIEEFREKRNVKGWIFGISFLLTLYTSISFLI